MRSASSLLIRASRAVVLAVGVAGGSTARAEPPADQRTGFAYGAAAAELTAGAVILIHLTTASSPGHGFGLALNMAPIAVGPVVGYLAHRAELDPRPAIAFHGGLVVGLDLFMVGTLIDGRTEPDGVRIGPAAITLAALGAAGGAYLGATRIDDQHELGGFLLGPFAGLAAGTIGAAIAVFVKDDARNDARIVIGLAGGMALGTAGSLLFALPDRARRSTSVAPRIYTDGTTTMVSFSGTL